MLKKWDKIWLNVLYLLGIFLLIVMVIFGSNWSWRLRLVWLVAAFLPMHACEEWQIPGGFHYQFNLLNKSNHPNKYPMSRLTDMVTICIAEVLYITVIPFYHANWIIMALCGFCLLEVSMHTIFGISMLRRFKSKGKKTIYNPGMATAYLIFGFLAGAMIYNLVNHAKISTDDWILTAVSLVVMIVVEILSPQYLLKDKNTSHGFESAGYFTKFLKK